MKIILHINYWTVAFRHYRYYAYKKQQTTRGQGIIGYVIQNDAHSQTWLNQSRNYFPTLLTVPKATIHLSIQSCWCVLEVWKLTQEWKA